MRICSLRNEHSGAQDTGICILTCSIGDRSRPCPAESLGEIPTSSKIRGQRLSSGCGLPAAGAPFLSFWCLLSVCPPRGSIPVFLSVCPSVLQAERLPSLPLLLAPQWAQGLACLSCGFGFSSLFPFSSHPDLVPQETRPGRAVGPGSEGWWDQGHLCKINVLKRLTACVRFMFFLSPSFQVCGFRNSVVQGSDVL